MIDTALQVLAIIFGICAFLVVAAAIAELIHEVDDETLKDILIYDREKEES